LALKFCIYILLKCLIYHTPILVGQTVLTTFFYHIFCFSLIQNSSNWHLRHIMYPTHPKQIPKSVSVTSMTFYFTPCNFKEENLTAINSINWVVAIEQKGLNHANKSTPRAGNSWAQTWVFFFGFTDLLHCLFELEDFLLQ